MSAAAALAAGAAAASGLSEFEQIAKALGESDRGRKFLEEFASHVRSADMRRVLQAIESIGDVVTRQNQALVSDVIQRELQDMSSAIAQTRKEISAIRPSDSTNCRIMAATEELDAIVTATERATGEILSSAEKLQDIAARLREGAPASDMAGEIDDVSTGIFMACSFQDITGQRTTKVVNVLRYLEQRVNAMIEMWGANGEGAPGGEALPIVTPDDPRPDAHLLSGPASNGEGVSQEDIDALFS